MKAAEKAADREQAIDNIKRAFERAVRDEDGRVMIYTILRSATGQSRKYQIFTLDRENGTPHWLMWSVAQVAGYRMDRKSARDCVIVGGGGFDGAEELAEWAALAAIGKRPGQISRVEITRTYRTEKL
jgi:hypothetical protein